MIRSALLLLISVFVISCGDSDDLTVEGNNYQLVRISGGLIGANEDLTSDQVFWNFSTGSDLTISKMTSKLFSGPAEGTYSFDFDDGTLRFGIEGTDQETWQSFAVDFSTEGDTLVLDEGVATDGFLYTLYQR